MAGVRLESLKTLNPMGCLKWNAITAVWNIVDLRWFTVIQLIQEMLQV